MVIAERTNGHADAMVVEIPGIEVRRLSVHLIGDSELITHKWSEKAKKEMLSKQMKEGKQAKEAKDPWMDFCYAAYWITPMPERPTPEDIASARFGMPAVAFKAAAVGACRHADMKMTEARGAFHVNGEFVEILGSPEIREDMVRVGMGTADLRYRPGFKTWSADLDISYNTRAISPGQIVNLLNLAGFGVGVGEWRPEKNGPYGRFHVANRADE